VFIVRDIKLVVDDGASTRHTVGPVRDIKPVVHGRTSTGPDHVVEASSNDISKLSAVADGSRLAIHGIIEFVGTVLK
jgi:hypothetical protein